MPAGFFAAAFLLATFVLPEVDLVAGLDVLLSALPAFAGALGRAVVFTLALLFAPDDFPLPEPPTAFPAIAPSTPPTTAPTGPATLPMTAPVAAPAVCFEIGGMVILSELCAEEDCFFLVAIMGM